MISGFRLKREEVTTEATAPVTPNIFELLETGLGNVFNEKNLKVYFFYKKKILYKSYN